MIKPGYNLLRTESYPSFIFLKTLNYEFFTTSTLPNSLTGILETSQDLPAHHLYDFNEAKPKYKTSQSLMNNQLQRWIISHFLLRHTITLWIVLKAPDIALNNAPPHPKKKKAKENNWNN